jgi:hypothetical protein
VRKLGSSLQKEKGESDADLIEYETFKRLEQELNLKKLLLLKEQQRLEMKYSLTSIRMQVNQMIFLSPLNNQ